MMHNAECIVRAKCRIYDVMHNLHTPTEVYAWCKMQDAHTTRKIIYKTTRMSWLLKHPNLTIRLQEHDA